jgi:uncharacterized repeat protein (TIGR01451 family)
MSLFGDATITNSTISGNTVSNLGANQGGGIVAATAAADPTPATLTLLNVTVAGNSVGGAGANVGGGLVGNSLGVTPVLTDLRSKNTIVAGNTVSGAAQDCGLVNASQSSHNLSSDASCGFTDSGSKQNVDPQLAPLAGNGGATDTRSFPTGSPALNAGDNAGCPAADQRGVPRPQLKVCDIGAYEARAAIGLTQRAKKKVRAGAKLTYKLKVTNRGEIALSNVSLIDRVPVRVRGLKKGKKTSCKFPKQKRKGKKRRKRALKCTFRSIPPGASRTVRIKVRPTKSKRLRNTARVTADGGLRDVARTVVRVRKP